MCNLLINESPLQVLPTLATWVGLNEAMFLQQLHYWMNNNKIGKVVDEVKWIRNTIDEWQESNFPFWDIGVIKRTIKNLEKDGLLLSNSQLNKMNIDRTKWYTINYAMLETLDGPVERIAAKIAKRKSACDKRDGVMATRKEQNVLIAKEQNVPMEADENKMLPCIGTKCSEGLEQNVPTNNQRLHRDYTENSLSNDNESDEPEQPQLLDPQDTLDSDTPECYLLFEKLATEYHAKGRRAPKKFPTLACKRKFLQAADKLNGTLEKAIGVGLENNIIKIPNLVNYISSPKWQNGGKKDGYGSNPPKNQKPQADPASRLSERQLATLRKH